MSFKGEFADILKEKMGTQRKTSQEKPSFQSEIRVSLDWVLPIWGPRRTWSPSKIPAAYPKVVIQPKDQTIEYNKKEEILEYNLTQLSPKGKKAFSIFVRLGAYFSNNEAITENELKTQYRQLARTYHPDSQTTQASSKYFNMCSVCYKLILNELKEFEKKAQ